MTADERENPLPEATTKSSGTGRRAGDLVYINAWPVPVRARIVTPAISPDGFHTVQREDARRPTVALESDIVSEEYALHFRQHHGTPEVRERDANPDCYALCARCEGPTNGVAILSVFNWQMICPTCKQEEMEAPFYSVACFSVEQAIQRGEYTSPGIGLQPIDEAFLIEQRKRREKEG